MDVHYILLGVSILYEKTKSKVNEIVRILILLLIFLEGEGLAVAFRPVL